MTARRRVLGACAGLVASAGLPWRTAAWAAVPPPLLPRPASLADEIRRALVLRKALVLMVSLDGCPFCRRVRESYLVPLRAQGQPVVQVELTRSWPLVDAAGRTTTHVQLVRALGVDLAPSVLFLGPGGVEVAERLVGIASADFYGAYLADRIDSANRAVAG